MIRNATDRWHCGSFPFFCRIPGKKGKYLLHSSTKAQESLWQVFHQVGCNEAVSSEARGSSITGKGMKRNT